MSLNIFLRRVASTKKNVMKLNEKKNLNVILGILGGIFVFLVISLICSAAKALSWLDFLYFCSYVKLGITLIKYIPQAFMNYR